MCISSIFGGGSKKSAASTAIVASTDNTEARRQADLEERMRRARAGAAANILTSQMGIPYKSGTAKTGEVAA